MDPAAQMEFEQQQQAAAAAAQQQAAAAAAATAAAAPGVIPPPAQPQPEAQEQALRNLILSMMQQHLGGNMGPHVAPEMAQQEAQRLVMESRARMPKPETFSGGKRPKDTEEWLFVLDTFLTASGVNLDIERITVASGYLRGAALTWWRRVSHPSYPNRPKTWSEFCQALLSTFQPINPAETARDTLARLRQTTSVRQYASAMRDTALDIPGISDDELKDRFIRGLKPATQTEVRLRAPDTFDDAVKIADRYDAMRYRITKPLPTGNPFGHRGGSNGPTPMELGAAVDAYPSSHTHDGNRRPKLTPALRQQLIKEGKCFFCRRRGHMALNCPERKQRTP